MRKPEQDPELKPMFDDIKANGPDVVMKYLGDESLMQKISQKLGGIDPEMLTHLTAIKDSSVSLHDARRGDLQRLQEFLQDGRDVNSKDFKGVTPLGYAVGHDQLSVVKVLIDAKANVNVLEHLLARGGNVSKVNQMGLTPLGAAKQNNQ